MKSTYTEISLYVDLLCIFKAFGQVFKGLGMVHHLYFHKFSQNFLQMKQSIKLRELTKSQPYNRCHENKMYMFTENQTLSSINAEFEVLQVKKLEKCK